MATERLGSKLVRTYACPWPRPTGADGVIGYTARQRSLAAAQLGSACSYESKFQRV